MCGRPGCNPVRLIHKARTLIEKCSLNVKDLIVLTEASTGAYIVSPILAAMAGADVLAVARTSRFGTFELVREMTMKIASLAGVSERVHGQADIITNSGHIRPIDAYMVRSMKSTAVIPLMYGAWEFRRSDLVLEACRR